MIERNGILFIHGAGLGSYIWKEVKQQIPNPMLAIDFPNREMAKNSNKNIPFEEYLHSAIQQIENWKIDQFTIVSHSIGGCLGLKLNDHFKEKVIGFIAIGAIIPKDGKSFTDCFPFPQKLILPVVLRLFGTRPPEKAIKHELCNDLTPSQSQEIINRFSSESVKLYTAKIRYESLPKESLYIKLTNDNAISQDMQDEMIQNLNSGQVVEFESGHLPMISEPKELADIINEYLKIN